MILTHKIELKPNNKQRTIMKKSAGCARLAYNWGLAQWRDEYNRGFRPNYRIIRDQFTMMKRTLFPFVMEVSKWTTDYSIYNLGKAFTNFFKGNSSYPKFKKKGIHDSFTYPAHVIKLKDRKIYLPKIGWVRMTEKLRFDGKLTQVTVSSKAGKWFASIGVDIPGIECVETQEVYSAIGIDLGINMPIVTSAGDYVDNIRSTKKYEKKLARAQRRLARKQKGSKNRQKAKEKVQRIHYKIANTRKDFIHKLTTKITQSYDLVICETLNVNGMLKNHKLAKALSDVSFGEIVRQFKYKAIQFHQIDQWFPSTKLCMSCGKKHELNLSDRTFECCGIEIDRDLHAAQNIVRQGLADLGHSALKACGLDVRQLSSLSLNAIECEAGNKHKTFL